jgi:hypothetical protein
MVKSLVGRNKINVIESVPYSELIFLIASGKNYALEIAEARGKKDSSPTAKQLKQIEKRGFLKSHKEKLLNKTIYSVNWEKIGEEFIEFLKNEKKLYLDKDNKINREFLDFNFSDSIGNRKEVKIAPDFKIDLFNKKYFRNSYLIKFLQSIFGRIYKNDLIKLNITIKDIFNEYVLLIGVNMGVSSRIGKKYGLEFEKYVEKESEIMDYIKLEDSLSVLAFTRLSVNTGLSLNPIIDEISEIIERNSLKLAKTIENKENNSKNTNQKLEKK